MTSLRRSAPATLRNRRPIADVFQQYLPQQARVLEVASGTGEHALFLAAALAVKDWWPTDIDPVSLASIEAWRQSHDDSSLRQTLHAPQPFDVTTQDLTAAEAITDLPPLDAVVCINMIHIAPWAATVGLMTYAEKLLREDGILYLYGPYRRGNRHTAPSNEAFDESLRRRDPTWGVRDLEAVEAVAADHSLALVAVVTMPANNLSVIFRKKTQPGT